MGRIPWVRSRRAAILMGPNHGDFLPAVELLKAAGALQVVHDDELALRVSKFPIAERPSIAWVLRGIGSLRTLRASHA